MLHSDTLSGLDAGAGGGSGAARAIATKSIPSKAIARTMAAARPLDHLTELTGVGGHRIVEVSDSFADRSTVVPKAGSDSEGTAVTGMNESRVSEKGPLLVQ